MSWYGFKGWNVALEELLVTFCSEVPPGQKPGSIWTSCLQVPRFRAEPAYQNSTEASWVSTIGEEIVDYLCVCKSVQKKMAWDLHDCAEWCWALLTPHFKIAMGDGLLWPNTSWIWICPEGSSKQGVFTVSCGDGMRQLVFFLLMHLYISVFYANEYL